MSNEKYNNWKQQTLPYVDFVLTPRWMVFTLLTVFIVCLPLGIGFYINNSKLEQITIDYTECAGTDWTTVSSTLSWKYTSATNMCSLRFQVSNSFSPSVLMYIKLTNFYQNSRLYVKSLDINQCNLDSFLVIFDIFLVKGDTILTAQALSTNASSSNCAWIQFGNCDTANSYTWKAGNGLTFKENNPDCLAPANERDAVIQNANANAQYYPCGLIANSMFSDEISNLTCVSGLNGGACSLTNYNFSPFGIAWKQDEALYNPTGWISDPSLASQIPTHLIPPPAWRKAWPNLWKDGYNSTNIPNLKTWERFQVWMRTAGLPSFTKLWGRNDDESLLSGVWQMDITMNYDVKRFSGTKSIVFSQVGALGVKK